MTINDDDIVILNIKTYERFKNSSVKANLVIDRLFELAQVNSTSGALAFPSSKEISDLLQLAYPERFKNKLQATNSSEETA